MDNVRIIKVWQDDEIMEIKVEAKSDLVSIHQNCYIQKSELWKASESMINYSFNYEEEKYIEFGQKDGNYTPTFSMCFLPADLTGHILIEMDMEINDNDTRKHRCLFYISSEMGCVELFGKKLKELIQNTEGFQIVLNP